ncbi:unnamed protein product [Soboliphyme baturini]|uniref:Ribosomal RNA-processing protein 4 n=1 Tax=Soboliphyme baturini TaxID=241478 RepID=A0A183IEG4_9BILA|nr:unnamed protein product [Soboliphyme baturini]
MSIDIQLECEKQKSFYEVGELKSLVAPGDVIGDALNYMRGHGTYVKDDQMIASVAGVISRVNKLVVVTPLKTRYNGEIGDIVVGRVTAVQPKRWKVDTHAKLDSVLLLSSVNLPGGEQRRKSDEDERLMRTYLREGDLVCLSQGVLLKFSPSLIKRRKNHIHNLTCGARIIFGSNGYVFISPTINEIEGNTGGFVQNLDPVDREQRQVIARLRNCIEILGQNRVMLYDTSVVCAYDASIEHEVKDILKPEVALEIVQSVRLMLEAMPP